MNYYWDISMWCIAKIKPNNTDCGGEFEVYLHHFESLSERDKEESEFK